MKKFKKVRIRKIAAVDFPNYPTPKYEDYTPGIDNGPVSIPIEYEVVGTLFTDIKIGSFIGLNRSERNGEKIAGCFRTSRIINIIDHIVETRNSKYLVEEMNL